MQELQKKDFWGPLLLLPHLTGVVYNDILHTVVPEPLQDEDPQTRIHLWIMYNNVLHFFLAVQKSYVHTAVFFLYSHVDSPSVVLAAYFSFTLYQTGK
jgi:hypothetical protein